MANIRVTWQLPTTRESGRPLSVSEIQGVEIALSADGGQNFVVIDTFPPNVTETMITELEDGEWHVRGVVIAGKRSQPVVRSIVIDTSAPGPLQELKLELL